MNLSALEQGSQKNNYFISEYYQLLINEMLRCALWICTIYIPLIRNLEALF